MNPLPPSLLGRCLHVWNSWRWFVVKSALTEIDLSTAVQISEGEYVCEMSESDISDEINTHLLSAFFSFTFSTFLTSSTFGGRGEIRTRKSGPSSIFEQ